MKKEKFSGLSLREKKNWSSKKMEERKKSGVTKNSCHDFMTQKLLTCKGKKTSFNYRPKKTIDFFAKKSFFVFLLLFLYRLFSFLFSLNQNENCRSRKEANHTCFQDTFTHVGVPELRYKAISYV
jgi:hypothetical protein